jgi:hypothetical protein
MSCPSGESFFIFERVPLLEADDSGEAALVEAFSICGSTAASTTRFCPAQVVQVHGSIFTLRGSFP